MEYAFLGSSLRSLDFELSLLIMLEEILAKWLFSFSAEISLITVDLENN